MAKITFILGGARSGKSQYALSLAKEIDKPAAFIATCQGLDAEMKKRIAIHKKHRPKNWKTYEAPREISACLKKISGEFSVIIIDCLTLLISNLLLKKHSQKNIEKEIAKTVSLLKKSKSRAIIVSNEVGMGIVPQNNLARNFRDIAGRINQQVASLADEVFFMVSGIPWRIK